MRTLAVSPLVLLLALPASAATLNVEVTRNGFTGPLQVAVAPRVDGRIPEWSSTKTIAAGQSAVTFPNLDAGLYLVLASGPQPLQRLSAKANLGSDGTTVQLAIPKTTTAVNVTLGGAALPRASIGFTHEALRWRTEVEMDEEGRFAGALWEPGPYSASVMRDRHSAPHIADVSLSPKPLTIDVPDRHVVGRVLGGDGKPLANAQVRLRTENNVSTLTVRAVSAPDGRFEFFGVREGSQMLTARLSSYLISDAVTFELRGTKTHAADLILTRGEPRSVQVIGTSNAAIDGAMLVASCDGNVKSLAVTNDDGRADVAVPPSASCAVFVMPKEGSLAAARVEGPKPLVIRVPEGASSLNLALKTDAGVPFGSVTLLMRVDGIVMPPEVSRLLATRGFKLMTGDEGSISLARIPPGTYEFWPYRTAVEGQQIYEGAASVKAPISVKVLTGENNATVKFRAR